MTPDIPRKCVLISGGMEIWVEVERAEKLCDALKQGNAPKFISLDGQLINTFEVKGVFTAQAMEELHRRKNGQWKCSKGIWHDKGKGCECKEYKEVVKAHVEGVGEVTYKR
jgi:hypothetical protein